MPVLTAPHKAPPNPYLTAVDLIGRLDQLLADARTRLHLTVAQQAAQIGISALTLARIGPDTNSTENTITACLRWLGANT